MDFFGFDSMSNSQLFSYYPKYEYLDKLLSINPKDTINIFVDVKGCSPALYQEWAVRGIIEKSKDGRSLDLSYFSAILDFIAFHKKYARKRGITIKFHFFMEQGDSQYHMALLPTYKDNRCSDFFDLDESSKELLHKVLDKNYELAEYTCNKIPDVAFYKLRFLEADFIPYYLLKYVIPDIDVVNSLNLIYTKDKDMHQCLSLPNTYQYYRGSSDPKDHLMIDEKIMLNRWARTDDAIYFRGISEWFPLLLAMVGDAADNIPGIERVGAKTVVNNLDAIIKIYGTVDEMYSKVLAATNVLEESKRFGKTVTYFKIFSFQNILSRNLPLISFKLLSEAVNGGFPSYMIDIKNQILEKYNNKAKLSNPKVILDAFNAKGLSSFISEQTVTQLF